MKGLKTKDGKRNGQRLQQLIVNGPKISLIRQEPWQRSFIEIPSTKYYSSKLFDIPELGANTKVRSWKSEVPVPHTVFTN
jgi:hypothetical protein